MALINVLVDELRDMYSAENQLVKAIQKLAKGAKNAQCWLYSILPLDIVQSCQGI